MCRRLASVIFKLRGACGAFQHRTALLRTWQLKGAMWMSLQVPILCEHSLRNAEASATLFSEQDHSACLLYVHVNRKLNPALHVYFHTHFQPKAKVSCTALHINEGGMEFLSAQEENKG
jgi:hypothetical protein